MSGVAPASSDRLTMIDGLRGVAAASVALHHFWNNSFFDGGRLRELMPSAGDWVLRHGHLGVVVFFCLSGYVIAHSLVGRRLTLGRAGNFIVRRSVRLDPPYFVTILLVVAANAASNQFLSSRQVAPPPPAQLLSHVVYLQELLGYGSILGVFWTLCLEVQLYLTFAGFVVLAHACVRPATEAARGPAALTRAAVWCGLLAAAVSLYWPLSGQPEMPRSGWLWMYWYLFLLGVFARWCEDDRLAYLGFGLLLSGAVVAAILWSDERAAAGAATAAAIRLAGATGRLRTALNWRWLQFLGAISYSLYLTHDVFGVKVLNLAVRLPSRGLWVELGVLSAVAALSLFAAYLLYRLVERPFVRLSRRLKTTATERLPA